MIFSQGLVATIFDQQFFGQRSTNVDTINAKPFEIDWIDVVVFIVERRWIIHLILSLILSQNIFLRRFSIELSWNIFFSGISFRGIKYWLYSLNSFLCLELNTSKQEAKQKERKRKVRVLRFCHSSKENDIDRGHSVSAPILSLKTAENVE